MTHPCWDGRRGLTVHSVRLRTCKRRMRRAWRSSNGKAGAPELVDPGQPVFWCRWAGRAKKGAPVVGLSRRWCSFGSENLFVEAMLHKSGLGLERLITGGRPACFSSGSFVDVRGRANLGRAERSSRSDGKARVCYIGHNRVSITCSMM